MTIKCGIIITNEIAISFIKNYIEKMPETELVLVSQNPLEIRNQINKDIIDLLFLDVELPEMSGLEFLQTLINPPKIVLTALKRRYAADAFELDVLDYIVRPFPFQRFLTAIKKFQKQDLFVEKSVTTERYFFLKENKKMVKVEIDDILYVESIKDYIKVATSSKTVTTKEQISNFYLNLPSAHFIRPHRSFLVNINKIDAYSYSIIEIAGIEVPIGRNYKEECIKRLDKLNQQISLLK